MNNFVLNVCLIVLMALLTGACSTLDRLSTSRVDRLKNGNFYKTYERESLPESGDVIGVLPVTVQPELDDFDFKYNREDPLLSQLSDTINLKIQSLLPDAETLGYSLLDRTEMPGIYVGSSEGDNAPSGAFIELELNEKYPPVVIYYDKPGKHWKAEAQKLTDDEGVDYILRVWISFAQYPKSDKGLVKKKVVLGTDHEKEIRFFSSEDKPVEVLQLVGYIADKNGNVVRAGAEGVIHNDTPFWLQVLDVEELIDDETISRLFMDERREDLPGNPLTLDVALKNLLAQLLDRDL